MIDCLLVTDDPTAQQHVGALLDDESADALDVMSWDAFERALGRDGLPGADAADVVLLGPGRESGDALAAGARLVQARPDVGAVLFANPSSKLLREALRAGIRDVVRPDAADAEVRKALERAGRAVAHHRAYAAARAEETRPPGRVITVLSPKGGAGKTVVATNLAVALATAAPGRVALVDADLQLGAVAQAMGLEPTRTVADVPRNGEVVDADAIMAALTAHDSKVVVLAAPDSLEQAEQVPADHLAAIVGQLAGQYSFVVVDTAAGLSEETLSILEVSTDAVLVASMDVPSVRQLRSELDALEVVGLTPQLHLVLNRADSRVGLEAKDVEGAVGLPATATLPSTRLVPLSLNQGAPMVLDQPRSRFARELAGLAGHFAEIPALKKRRWGR